MAGAGMSPAVEIEAACEDRMFIVFGPQVIAEESGPRVLTPEAMDGTGLWGERGFRENSQIRAKRPPEPCRRGAAGRPTGSVSG